jgi:spore germination protein GerM
MKRKQIFFLALIAVILAFGGAACFWFFKGVNGDKNNSADIANEAKTREILLYYYNYQNDKDASGNIQCGRNGLAAVNREISFTPTPIQDAIRLLLKGQILESERLAGISTEFPLAGVELLGADLENGVLTLEFADPQNKTGGGACRAGILWFQIEATAKQFEGVREVRFIPETLFQP